MVVTRLLEAREAEPHWTGELSSSALSTATAVCALAIARRQQMADAALVSPRISQGLDWLASHVNPDGGWGDTILSLSNISTTTLCWAAFGLAQGAERKYASIVSGAEGWLRREAGGLTPEALSSAILRCYGNDRTFSAPILTTCALAGRFGAAPEAWSQVVQLPFELAVCPPAWFAALRLPVVSYALPALIAIGLARHRHRPSRNPFTRGVRALTEPRAMAVLQKIQPSNGGFLEATPLTSFVVMSLAASGYEQHPVTRKSLEFLLSSARADGSWPIDTNLSTWLTTLALNALGQAPSAGLSEPGQSRSRQWLLDQQYRRRHLYTNAAPGGWAWTHLPGGVPDADDTAGALLALRGLGPQDERGLEAARQGIEWLLDLQNRDGGVPTFCRGWGKLAFDQSSPDLTAHALHAWASWLPDLPSEQQRKVRGALARAQRFLRATQQREGPLAGAWKPLWFGNQLNPDQNNWTYGTSRVLIALASARPALEMESEAHVAARWLVGTQLGTGGWGGGSQEGNVSVEETALATEALAAYLQGFGMRLPAVGRTEVEAAMEKGVHWLLDRVDDGSWLSPAPIGFYFAKLWYFERLYPLIFSVGALGRVARLWQV